MLLSLSESHTDTNMNPYNINIRVFGTKVGDGGGVDFGQAGCGAVPSTCMTWGFGVNTGGFCDRSRIGEMVHLIQIGTPIVVFPTKG